jgi:1-aminocyclopropane-1-carboxylate deaminase
LINTENIRLDKIELPLLKEKGIELSVLRLDLLNQVISGNKWFKLKYNLENIKQNGITQILTFGGAYSNHIVASAAAAQLLQLKSIGIIRGEKPSKLSHSLEFAQQCGMQFYFESRDNYRNKNNEEYLKQLREKFPEAAIIPEGGANEFAVKGCAEINNFISVDTDIICCACGTGSTLAGIISALKAQQYAIGFPVLKNGNFLATDINLLLNKISAKNSAYSLVCDYHFGGYAKYTQELIDFMNTFYSQTHIPLDFVYTGKMMFGLFDLIKKNELKNSKIVAIHSGGLQGNQSIKELLVY